MGAGRDRSGFAFGHWLTIVAFALLCCGCFSAKRFLLPTGENVRPILDKYEITIRLANANSATFMYTTNDTLYRLALQISRSATGEADLARDSSQTIRLEDVCLAASCLSEVYCPVLISEEFRTRRNGPEDSVRFSSTRNYNYGRIDLADECDSLRLSFRAALVDAVSDSLLMTERVEVWLGLEKKKVVVLAM